MIQQQQATVRGDALYDQARALLWGPLPIPGSSPLYERVVSPTSIFKTFQIFKRDSSL